MHYPTPNPTHYHTYDKQNVRKIETYKKKKGKAHKVISWSCESNQVLLINKIFVVFFFWNKCVLNDTTM